MKAVDKDIKDRLITAAKKCQQNFYELLSDWNSYDQKKPQCLKNFIGIALFGPPKIDDLITDNSLLSVTNLEDEVLFHDPHQQKKINKIYEKIYRHGIQNTIRKEIMCGLIYNITFDMSIEKGKYFSEEHLIKCLQPVPIFKVLKNVVKRNESGKIITTKLVIYYIDENERVYKNWNDYLNNNLLPECIMVLPKGGEYQGDYKNQWSEKISYVWIEIYKSPACQKKTVNAINSINNFVSLGCAGVGVAAVFNPVGATVVALSAVGMGLTGLWSVGKNSYELADRHLHEQSISIKDKDGFIQCFGVASSALAVVSSGGSMFISKAIQNGTSLSTVAKVVHGSLQIGSIAASGINVGILGYMSESHLEKKSSTQDALNLISSLLLFSNSVVDLQLLKNILEKNQIYLIEDFEHSLRCSRHRKEFCRMVRNSISLTSNPNSPEQIIRSTINISIQDLVSSFIVKNTKLFSLTEIEVSSSNGLINIDGKYLLKPADFVKKFERKANGVQPITIALTNNCSISDSIFEKVLKNFLARYKKEFQSSKPNLSQFSSFLREVSEIDKPDIIFAKILLIGIKLVRKISNVKYLVNNILSETINFVWEFIQMNLREKIGPIKKCEEYREFLMKIIIGVYGSVEDNIDEWIDSFRDYLKIKLKQMQERTKSDKKGKLYLLHVM